MVPAHSPGMTWGMLAIVKGGMPSMNGSMVDSMPKSSLERSVSVAPHTDTNSMERSGWTLVPVPMSKS